MTPPEEHLMRTPGRHHSPSFIAALTLVGAFSAILAPSQANAQCAGKIDLENATLQSEAVVYGKITALEPHGETHWVATIDVLKPFKGKVRKESTIEVSAPMGEGELEWQVEQSVMLYMKKNSDGGWATSSCDGSKVVESEPLAAETNDFFPLPPADASLETRARRASAIFTGKVTAAGRGYAGRWDGVMIKVKVKDGIKGIKKNATVQLRLDGDSCNAGKKKRDLLSDVDLLQGDASSPFEVDKTYLFFAYDDMPYQVMLCHENMQDLGEAGENLRDLKKMCKRGGCDSGHDDLTSLRKTIKGGLEKSTVDSLESCAKKLPLYSSAGAITDLDLKVRLQPGGKVELLDVSSRGTLSDGQIYNALGACMQEQLGTWEVGEQAGRPDLEASIKLQMKEASRGPTITSSEVILSGR